MPEARAQQEAEEDREAFRYGVQIANEVVMRRLLALTLSLVSEERRPAVLKAVADGVRADVAQRLGAADCGPDSIEHASAADIINSVLDGIPT